MSEKPTYEELQQRVLELERVESERKLAEEALRQSEEKFRRIYENSVVGFFQSTPEGRFLRVNHAFAKMLGYESPEELVSSISDITSQAYANPKDRSRYHKSLKAHGYVEDFELKVRCKDGSEVWLSDSSRAFFDKNGEAVRYEGIVVDITERKRAEKALRDSEKNYRDIFENSNDAIFVHDAETGQIVDVNRTACEMFGHSLEEMKRMDVGDFSLGEPPYTQKQALEWIQKAYQYGPQRFEWLARNKQGELMWFENSLLCAEIADKNRVLVFGRNIDDRKKAEHDRERLLSAMEQAAEVMVITDPDGVIQYVNPAFERVTGYTAEEVKGKNPRILKSGKQDEGFYRELWQTITSGRNWQGRFVNRRKDGSLYTEEASISPVIDVTGRINNFVAVKRDITSEIELETRLAQAQKMEAIGTLAGGIAHDFNNILSAVMGYSEMAKSDLPKESYASQCIEEVLLASHRAKALVKQILAFSRFSEEGMQPLKAGLLLKEAVKLLRASLPSTIEMRTEISASKDTILANATQTHQVVMNLCTNAYHAMHDSGGILTVTLKELDVDAKDTAGYDDLDPGRYLVLGISDTGHGMSPEVMERIFDPYFTTKEKGVGTGLGLSVVHGIVKRHGGTIRVWSLPGEGTTFQVMLPVIEESAAVSAPAPVDAPKGTGRILFVDDEAPIANIGRQMLRRLGYDVEVATGSMEALERFESCPDDFDLVITDMTMPHLRGDELARAVMDVRPDMPVILCTGYSDMINKEKARGMGIREVLEKPVGMLEMAGAVHDVLSGEDHSRGDG